MLTPEFFLASISDGWSPRVVAIYGPRDVVGILYAKERVISGLRTGIIYADGSLGEILLADPWHQQTVLRVGVSRLLVSPGIRGMRIRVVRSSDELAMLREVIAQDTEGSALAYCYPIYNSSQLWVHHAHLALPASYPEFLERLGSTTRHNFRYYRRRFEKAGHQFVEHVPMDELRTLARDLRPKSKLAAMPGHGRIEKWLNMVTAANSPIAVGLRHANGEWMSVVGGWYTARGAVLCFQCNNDLSFGNDSLSVVMRAYLIDYLIRQRRNELVIWADTGPPLSRYVTYVPTIGVRLDVPSYRWRLARFVLGKVGPLLPRRFASAAQWIV